MTAFVRLLRGVYSFALLPGCVVLYFDVRHIYAAVIVDELVILD
jgi:hypothetical protein